jgi:hypothetical protein
MRRGSCQPQWDSDSESGPGGLRIDLVSALRLDIQRPSAADFPLRHWHPPSPGLAWPGLGLLGTGLLANATWGGRALADSEARIQIGMSGPALGPPPPPSESLEARRRVADVANMIAVPFHHRDSDWHARRGSHAPSSGPGP